MDKLPESLLLEILSRLDNSADVACCRVASKAFNNVFPDLRSIKLLCSRKWCKNSGSMASICFKKVFLDLISKLRVVESVCICLQAEVDVDPADKDFEKEWLPMVSQTLKSLSLSGLPLRRLSGLNILPLISKYCHNLAELNLRSAWLSVYNLNAMPMLTSLILSSTILQDQHINQFNKCFPNLHVLKLEEVRGLKEPKIHLLNLQTCHWSNNQLSLTLITPNLITLRIECLCYTAIHVEAPMLSHFHLSLNTLKHAGFLLSEFPTTKTVKTLILDSRSKAPGDARYSKLTLGKVFRVFPNASSLRINSGAWSELGGWEILDGRIGLKNYKTISNAACIPSPLPRWSHPLHWSFTSDDVRR